MAGNEISSVGKCSFVDRQGSDMPAAIPDLAKYYKAIAAQNSAPSLWGFGFNKGGQAATSAGFQASNGQPAFA